LDQLKVDYPGAFQAIRYHMSWPSPFDPFYNANMEENDARRTFYGVNYVPNLWFDGVANPGAVIDSYEAALLQRMGETSPLELSVAVENGFAAVTAHAVEEIDGDFRLLTVIVENQTELGAKHYDEVMRAFVGGTRGVTLSLAEGESYSALLDFDVGEEWVAENLQLVVFAQMVQGKEVLQCASTAIDFSMPKLELGALQVDDAAGGDGDLRFEGGESGELVVELSDLEPWADAGGVEITLSSEDPSVTVIDGSGSIAAIAAGESGSNVADPFALEIAVGAEPHWVTLEFEVSANEGVFERQMEAQLLVGHPALLLVDDDGGAEFEGAYLGALDSLELVYEAWDVAAAGLPSGDFFDLAEQVIWFTGEVVDGGLEASDQALLRSAFDAGKGLYLSGRECARGEGQAQLLAEVFGLEFSAQGGSQVASGAEGDPIGDGVALLLEHNPMTCDAVQVTGQGVEMLYYLPGMQVAGVHAEGPGSARSVFSAFDFSVINEAQRSAFLEVILQWLAQPTGVAGGSNADGGLPLAARGGFALSNAPNPFNPATTISYSLPRAARVRLAIYSLRGELVATLVNGEAQAAGAHRVTWLGRNRGGGGVASGVYLLSLEEDGVRRASRKMLLLK
jgi:hypothetical protein